MIRFILYVQLVLCLIVGRVSSSIVPDGTLTLKIAKENRRKDQKLTALNQTFVTEKRGKSKSRTPKNNDSNHKSWFQCIVLKKGQNKGKSTEAKTYNMVANIVNDDRIISHSGMLILRLKSLGCRL